MKRFSITTAIVFLSAICTFAQIKVFPVSDSEAVIKKNAFLYYLPQTTLEIKISVTTETLVPGPYSKYAEKYLCIKNVPTNTISDVKIDNVDVRQISQPDPNACFMVVCDNDANINYNSRGIILGYNCGESQEDTNMFAESHFSKQSSLEMPVFTDYGVKRNFTGNTDTTYKVVEVDSVFQKIPIYNKVIVSKDEEMKAEEAANYIIKIRKRLFKIVTAQFDTSTPPADIDLMVKELKDMEKHYLELFIGKVVSETNEFVFYYTPQSELAEEKVPVCYVTADDEVVTKRVENSEPIYLVLSNGQSTKEVGNFYGRQFDLKKKEKEMGLYYRIPSEVSVSVDFDDFTYYRSIMTIPQCGYLGHLPADLFKNKNLKVAFDEKLGSIRGIYTK
ncbi:MAG: DUF4831 family protein [Bacteroidales bacterium]|nr:DUF4831 family protein [Bacteroidales bacterium]